MKSKLAALILGLILTIPACSPKEKTCVVVGMVNNRPQSAAIRLVKSFDDFRSQSAILIPIKDSTFIHEIKFDAIEAYTFVFEDEHIQGAMRPITFFTSEDTVKIELFPAKDFDKNTIVGGIENEEFTFYKKKKQEELERKTAPIFDSIKVLQTNDNYHSQMMKEILEKLNNTEIQEDKSKIYTQIDNLYQSGEGFTLAAQKLHFQHDSIRKILFTKELDYLNTHITIPSYYTLIKNILYTEQYPEIYQLKELRVLQKKYADKFKNHPFTQYSNSILWRFANIKVGGNYFDVSLPDTNDKQHTLSEQIQGKYAYIDIWAPWCGPCIAKSREMIAVFEEFKVKDFTVVGIASKYRDIADVKNQLEKDRYPWLTLIDKPDLNSGLNEHYGIENAGGLCVLVDKTGKIILKDPTIEEVENFLKSVK